MLPDGTRSVALVHRLMRDFMRRHAGKIILAFVCMGLAAASTAARAWLMEPVLDRIFVARDASLLFAIGAVALALALRKGFADYGENGADDPGQSARHRRCPDRAFRAG